MIVWKIRAVPASAKQPQSPLAFSVLRYMVNMQNPVFFLSFLEKARKVGYRSIKKASYSPKEDIRIENMVIQRAGKRDPGLNLKD